MLLFLLPGLLVAAPAALASEAASGSPSNVTPEEVLGREEHTLDLLSRIDAFAEQDERLRADAARAHYNMGNIYFQKGEFEIAAREYYQAMILMPDDPDVHYNLAFVSGEHLRDFRTALKHYRMYLYLNPEARDKTLVKEKVVELELIMRQMTDSILDTQEKYKY
jgi:tetratricopeptide (TPR) repeat protein